MVGVQGGTEAQQNIVLAHLASALGRRSVVVGLIRMHRAGSGDALEGFSSVVELRELVDEAELEPTLYGWLQAFAPGVDLVFVQGPVPPFSPKIRLDPCSEIEPGIVVDETGEGEGWILQVPSDDSALFELEPGSLEKVVEGLLQEAARG
jgi:hypothetical protein